MVIDQRIEEKTKHKEGQLISCGTGPNETSLLMFMLAEQRLFGTGTLEGSMLQRAEVDTRRVNFEGGRERGRGREESVLPQEGDSMGDWEDKPEQSEL